MLTVDLQCVRDARKSFYGKARVEIKGGKKSLISYSTEVARVQGGCAVVLGRWSDTTTRHIKEFLYQENFKAESMKQMWRDYGGEIELESRTPVRVKK